MVETCWRARLTALLRRPKRVWVSDALREMSKDAMEKARKTVYNINRRKAANAGLERHWDGLNGADYKAWRKKVALSDSDSSVGTDESSFSRRGLVRVSKLKDFRYAPCAWRLGRRPMRRE